MHHQASSCFLHQSQCLVQFLVFGETDAHELVFAAQDRPVHEDLEGNGTLLHHPQDVCAIEGARSAEESDIDDGLLFDESPAVAEGLGRGTARLGDRHLQDGGHTSRRSGPCFGVEVAPLGVRWGAAVEVDVNCARENKHTRGVYGSCSLRETTWSRQSSDSSFCDAHVGMNAPLFTDD